MEFIADTRETAVIPNLNTHIADVTHHINFRVEQITLGDYFIRYGDYMLLFERKTWADLASSIRDGRIENLKRLLLERDNNPDNVVRVIYIIEGRYSKRRCRIPEVALQGYINHITLRDGVQVAHTGNPEETAKYLVSLSKSLYTLVGKSAGGVADTDKIVKRRTVPTIDEQRMSALCALPHVGATNQIPHSIHELFTMDEKQLVAELSETRYTTGHRLGERRAKKIVAGLHDVDTPYKVLKTIRGVSPKLAKHISETCGVDIVNTTKLVYSGKSRAKTLEDIKAVLLSALTFIR